MWLVRHATMLMLMVAFMLPSGVYRRCCCSQRVTSNPLVTVKEAEQADATEANLPPCCLAKAKAKLKLARSAEARTPQLTHPPCRCSVSNTVAVVVTKAESIANVDETFVYADRQEAAESLFLTSSFGPQTGQFEPIARPPLRTLLCRLVI